MPLKPCPCGSGRDRHAQHDARGIFLAFTCTACHAQKMARYRPEVRTDPNYHADEPIDGDGYDTSLEDANRAR